ncbi:MAG: coproporphyrinogen-III oxidase family protein [Pyrinomonadaceae bacterium]
MNPAGIYLHIPFCRSRCSYCDFATDIYDAALADRYTAALIKEIDAWRNEGDLPEVDTIYFGGGTPSLLAPAQATRILECVRARFRVQPGAEVTMEMNPGTVTPQALAELRRAGINRASFGAQTFDDQELRRLGRSHTAADARRTLRDLRAANYENINLDLIAGLPGQTRDAWARNLDAALELRPEHLSLYLLEVHEGTPLASQIRRGVQPQPSDDAAVEMYQLMLRRRRGRLRALRNFQLLFAGTRVAPQHKILDRRSRLRLRLLRALFRRSPRALVKRARRPALRGPC